MAQTSPIAHADLLQTVFSCVDEPMLVFDEEGRYLEVNEAACTALGLAREEVVGRRLEELIATAFDSARALRRLKRDGRLEGEIRVTRRDGEQRMVQVTAVANIAPERHLAVARDVTERRRVEQRFEASFRHSGVAMAITTVSEGLILDLNEAMCRLVGRPREDLIGRTSREVGVWQDWAARETLRERLIRGEPLRNEPITFMTNDGDPREMLLSADALTLDEGDVVLSQMLDVTPLRTAQAALHQAQKMEAVGRLAGGIAHDFNNMLAAILGFATMMEHAVGPNDPMRRPMDQILRATRRARELTRQLLTFSRKQLVQRRVLDLNAQVGETQVMLRRLIGEDVSLVLRLTATAPINADPSEIEQVLMNLAVNARDAMPGGGTLTIETADVTVSPEQAERRLDLLPGSYVLLTVGDTGIGMDDEVRGRIFEPFFTTKEKVGTGLGLSTVYGIVRQARGAVDIESAPGKGATFRVWWPRSRRALDPAEARAERCAAAKGGYETVLLVEDEEVVRDVAEEILSRSGYRVLPAASPGDALLLTDRHEGPIHLLLSDVVMPVMSGPELAGRLRERLPDLKVAFLSGWAADVRLAEELERGTAFLQKPFERAELLDLVRRVLDD